MPSTQSSSRPETRLAPPTPPPESYATAGPTRHRPGPRTSTSAPSRFPPRADVVSENSLLDRPASRQGDTDRDLTLLVHGDLDVATLTRHPAGVQRVVECTLGYLEGREPGRFARLNVLLCHVHVQTTDYWHVRLLSPAHYFGQVRRYRWLDRRHKAQCAEPDAASSRASRALPGRGLPRPGREGRRACAGPRASASGTRHRREPVLRRHRRRRHLQSGSTTYSPAYSE